MQPKLQTTKDNLINQWSALLEVRFGGMDFWRLNKTWKRTVYRDVAQMIFNDMEFIIKEGVEIVASEVTSHV